MMRGWVFAIVAGLALAGCGSAVVAAERRPAATSEAALERRVLELVNRHRAGLGLRPLGLDARISTEARRHSAAQAARRARAHDGFEDRIAALHRVISFRHSAENVAFNKGYDDPADQAVRGWLRSPGHCRNIEDRYEWTGVGVARSRDGTVFFTQLFVGR